MRDDTRSARPAPWAADRQPPAGHAGRRAARRRDTQPAGFRGRVLPGAGHRPGPAGPAYRLPRRRTAGPAGPLDELRALLLHPATSASARNKVWAELVRRARSGSPAWIVGLVGVAMPGLRRAAASLSASYRGDPADLHIEILTGFLAAMRALDLDDLDRVPLASRLCWAAWRAGQALACADAHYTASRRDLPGSYDAPYLPWGHPDFVLAAAVTRGVLSPAQAELIGRNRLEKIPLAQIAAEMGISHSALCNRRKRAEKAITDAIRGGRLSVVHVACGGLHGGRVRRCAAPRWATAARRAAREARRR
jgi:predicted DNA-binding protein (UPF0251 family)